MCCAPFAAHWGVAWILLATGLGVLTLFFANRLMSCLGGWPSELRNLVLLVLALHPFLVNNVRAVTFLPFAVCLLTLWAWVALLWTRRKQWRTDALFGLVTGGLLLTHGIFLPVLLGLLLVGAVLRYRHLQQQLPRLAIPVLVAAVLAGGWAGRNYKTFGQAFPLFSGAGLQYWAGKAVAEGNHHLPVRVYHAATGLALTDHYHGTPTPQADAVLFRLAVADIRQHPIEFLQRYAAGLVRFWVPADRASWQQWLSGVVNMPVVVFTVLGFLRYQRLRKSLALRLLLLILLVWAGFAAFFPHNAYFAMLLPVLWALAGTVGLQIFRKPLSIRFPNQSRKIQG